MSLISVFAFVKDIFTTLSGDAKFKGMKERKKNNILEGRK